MEGPMPLILRAWFGSRSSGTFVLPMLRRIPQKLCQGVAFSNLNGGCYYPAASMYTLPNQPPCVVMFNFGPDFEKFPQDFGERPLPRAMIEVPYQSPDDRVENGVSTEKISG